MTGDRLVRHVRARYRLSGDLMHRSVVLTLLGACAAVACSAFGTDSTPASVVDGGTNAPPDSSAPLVDSGSGEDAARPDARPPDKDDCATLTCGGAGNCADESCGTLDGGHWPDKHVSNAVFDDTATDCTSTTTASGQTAFKSATLTGGGRFEYSLRFQFTTNLATTATIAEIATGTTVAVRVKVDAGQIRVCNAAGACTPPQALLTGDLHVYGRLGSAERYGSAVVLVGRQSCTEVGSLDRDGPFPGETVTASVGCLGDAPCSLTWDDARFVARRY